jgi:haloacetate dehalogenase
MILSGFERREILLEQVAINVRAAATDDLVHDRADAGRNVVCPTPAMWGADGRMAGLFDIGATWAARVDNLERVAIPGGHFFVDQHPELAARHLSTFLARNACTTRRWARQ